MRGWACAASSSLSRSRAVETLRESSPEASAKRVLGHAECLRLGVHGRDECLRAAGGGAGQCRRRAVVGGAERGAQQVIAREDGADSAGASAIP